jgi:hypothetical protein
MIKNIPLMIHILSFMRIEFELLLKSKNNRIKLIIFNILKY